MSWLNTRTDGELVDLVAEGDRRARAMLVDRTLVPASQVAMWLEADRDRAVDALIGAYTDVFRRLPELEDRETFLHALLLRLDATAPFPLDPATMAPLDPVDRERVRGALVGATPAPRRIPVMAATLIAVAAIALGVTLVGPGDQDDGIPASTPTTSVTDDVVQAPTEQMPSDVPTDEPGTPTPGTTTTELAETR